MSVKKYDLIVIGGGPAGQQVAKAGAQSGLRVAITEGYAYGGACSLRGCDPKMVLHGVADAFYDASLLCGKGIVEEPRISWSDLMTWKRSFTEPVPENSTTALQEAGVTVYAGYASFLDARTVRFGREDNAPRASAGRVVIATGMQPASLGIPGEEHTHDSEQFLDMDDLPDHLVIIGGGYIGTGFACLAQLLGATVEVIVTEASPVEQFDPQLSQLLQEACEERGIKFHTNSKATRVEASEAGAYVVHIEHDGGSTHEVITNRVIHCAGRTPMLEKLDLDRAGVAFDEKKGIKVSKALRTNVPHIYACGDCTDSGLPLTPVAAHEAKILIDNLFHDGEREINYYPIPTVCFSAPAIASVGMMAEEAERSDRKLRVKYENATDWFSARRLNAQLYAYKVIIDEDKDQLLGAHLVGPRAEELINVFALAMHQQIPVSELRHMIYTYPTACSDIASMLAD